MINKAVMREYKVITGLVICQKLKHLWHFAILTWESMRNPKMCIILKTADRSTKRTKIWDSWSCVLQVLLFGVIRCTLQNVRF